MASLNKVFLMGNLGADPEKRYTGSGQAVTNFRIATTARWNDKQGNKQERTEWHRVVVYGPQAENCEKYLAKGRQVLVEGEIRYGKWEDNQGNTRYSTDIVAQRVQFLGGPRGTADRTEESGVESFPEAAPVNQEPPANPTSEDDVPF